MKRAGRAETELTHPPILDNSIILSESRKILPCSSLDRSFNVNPVNIIYRIFLEPDIDLRTRCKTAPESTDYASQLKVGKRRK